MFSLIVASKLPCRVTGGEMHPSCSNPNVNNALLRWTPGIGAERWENWLALVHRWCVGVLLRCCTGAHALQQLVFQHSCKVRPFSSQRAALVSTVWRVWSWWGACREKNPTKTTVTHITCCGRSVKEQPDTWGFTIFLKFCFIFSS